MRIDHFHRAFRFLVMTLILLVPNVAASQGESGNEPSQGLIDACASLTRAQCMASPMGCILDLAEPGSEFAYVCRPFDGPCQLGWAQDSGESSCTVRLGCTYTPSACYCHCQGYGSIAAGEKLSCIEPIWSPVTAAQTGSPDGCFQATFRAWGAELTGVFSSFLAIASTTSQSARFASISSFTLLAGSVRT